MLQFGSFDLSSFWKTPAEIWRAEERAGRHDDVVARAARQQLGLDDLVAVENVVDDLDPGLLGEFLKDRFVDIVRPVVDVDDAVFRIGRSGGHEDCGDTCKKQFIHDAYLLLFPVVRPVARQPVLRNRMLVPTRPAFGRRTLERLVREDL